MNNLILDIDHTLVSPIYIPSLSNRNKQLLIEKKREFQDHLIIYDDNDSPNELYVIFIRNGLDEFLEYVFNNYNISIWTAATKDYMIYIIRNVILKNPKYNLDYLLFKYHSNISKKKYNLSKHLQILMNEFNLKNYTLENTLILDDKEEVSPKNNGSPYNETPYKSLWIKPCNIFDESFKTDNELTTIITELNTHFQSVKQSEDQSVKQSEDQSVKQSEDQSVKQSEDQSVKQSEILPEGWKKVQSSSRPGQFSFENKFGERIPDPPKYSCGEFPNSSKDLEDYE